MLKIPSAARTWTSCAAHRDDVQERNDYASSLQKIMQLHNRVKKSLAYSTNLKSVPRTFGI